MNSCRESKEFTLRMLINISLEALKQNYPFLKIENWIFIYLFIIIFNEQKGGMGRLWGD